MRGSANQLPRSVVKGPEAVVVKHSPLFLLLLLFPSLLFATAYDGTDNQSLGMGIKGFATNGEYASLFANPATLTSGKERFYFLTKYWDAYEAGETVVNTPSSSILLSFCGDNLAFTVEMHNSMTSQSQGSGFDNYDSTTATRLQLDWGYTFSRFSVGVSFKTTTYMRLSPAVINDGQRISDYIVQAFFKRYNPVYGKTSLSAGCGLFYDNDWLKIGVVSDQFANATTGETISFSFLELYRSFGIGLCLSTPTYSKDGQLNLLKAAFSAEIADAGDSENAQTRLGVECTFQLLPECKISLRSGYHDTKNGLAIQKFNLETAYNSFGLGVLVGAFRLDFGAEVPVSLYMGNGYQSVPFSLSFAYVK